MSDIIFLLDSYRFAVVDIDTLLRWLAAYLEALQCPPVVIVVIIGGDIADAGSFADVEDVWLFERAVEAIADERQGVVNRIFLTIDPDVQHYLLLAVIFRRSHDGQEVIASLVAGRSTALTVDEGTNLCIVALLAVLLHHRNDVEVVRIEIRISRLEMRE